MTARDPRLTRAYALAEQGRPAEGLRMIADLARQGDAEALFALADQYWHGRLVPQDCRRGRELFRMASDAGHPIARRAWTNLLASGIAGAADWPRAVARLREEAREDGRRARMLGLIEAMALHPSGSPVHLPPGETLATRPQITLYRGAVTPEECAFVMLVAEASYGPSLVAGANGDYRDPVRTSDGATIYWLTEDPAIHALNRRLAALAGVPAAHGEPLQVLRYAPGQQYRRHLDWLGGAPGARRILTALIYLDDGYEGGETEFHKIGLKVRGRRGDVLVFRSEGADGRAEPLSEHAGLPVTRGTKYLASRWMRDGPQHP